MHNTKHTPGPWFASCNIVSGDFQQFRDGFRVAVASKATGSEAEMTANANLIASAPELLAALRALLVVADHPNNPLATGACSSIVADARAAIAKATGQGGAV